MMYVLYPLFISFLLPSLISPSLNYFYKFNVSTGVDELSMIWWREAQVNYCTTAMLPADVLRSLQLDYGYDYGYDYGLESYHCF